MITRRDLLVTCGGAIGSLALAAPSKPRMGVVIHSFALRKFVGPLEFLDYCSKLDAGGVQMPIGLRDEAYADKVRQLCAKQGLYLEGSIRLPMDAADEARFAEEVRSAKRCGATVLRAALGGRRYELFDTADQFKQFANESWQALLRARPVIEKEQVRLAVENHKDWRADDLLGMIRKLDSPGIGVCIDTGNSIALLEEPHRLVETYAPFAWSTHIKDMGLESSGNGFLLAEVPLGQGYLDLARIMAAIRKARPEARFNLEMITRDPLSIPVLTKKYWATLTHVPATELAEMLAAVQRHGQKPLPRVSQLGREDRLKLEEDNVRRSLEHAAKSLPG